MTDTTPAAIKALLPCPFCGADATEEQGITDNVTRKPVYYVCCTECNAQNEGVQAWNNRAILTNLLSAHADVLEQPQ